MDVRLEEPNKPQSHSMGLYSFRFGLPKAYATCLLLARPKGHASAAVGGGGGGGGGWGAKKAGFVHPAVFLAPFERKIFKF